MQLPYEAVDRVGRALLRDRDLIGLRVDDRYEILHSVACGGMAEVFYARDLRLDRPVAMKVLSRRICSPQGTERFEAEARATSSIDHPGVVPIHDLGVLPDGRLYYTMKFVEGRTLEAMLGARADRRELLRLLLRVAEIVHRAHQKGVVHRDLKPANLMVDRHGHAYVLDWGIARVRDGLPRDAGAVLGTPQYMAPEQARGDDSSVGPAADVYSLGAVLYRILTGRAPFAGSPSFPAPREIDPSISPELETICLTAMNPDPACRYPSAEALADALRRFQDRRATRPRLFLVLGLLPALIVPWMGLSLSSGSNVVPPNDREASLRFEAARNTLEQARLSLYRKDSRRSDWSGKIEESLRILREGIALAPDEAVGPFLEGCALEWLHDEDAAERAWRRAVAIDPGFSPAHYRLGRLRVRQAFEVLGCRVETAGEQPRPRFRRLATEAVEELQTALASGRFDYRLDLEFAKAVLEFARSSPSDARKLALAGIEEFDGQPGVEDFHWLAGITTSGEEAIRSLDAALDRKPGFSLALLARSLEHFRAGNLEASIRDCTAALDCEPTLAVGYNHRGNVYALRGDLESALTDYGRAVAVPAIEAEARVNRSLALRRLADRRPAEALGLRHRALADLNAALSLDENFEAIYYCRGNLRMDLGDLAGALADFEEVLRRDSRHALSCVGMGQVHQFSGRLEAAEAEFSRALEIVRVPQALVGRGALYLEWGFRLASDGNRAEAIERWRQALGDLEELARTYPERADAHFLLGHAHAALEDPAVAIEHYTKSLDLDPLQADAYYRRGEERRKLGDAAGARADFERVTRLAPAAAFHRVRAEERLASLIDRDGYK